MSGEHSTNAIPKAGSVFQVLTNGQFGGALKCLAFGSTSLEHTGKLRIIDPYAAK